MSLLKRVWLFGVDYCQEFGCAWSLARTRDCERNGGHRWAATPASNATLGWSRTCSRCKCSELLPTAHTNTATTTATSVSYTFGPNWS